MDTNSTGVIAKCSHYYWGSVERAHKLKILKYPLLCLLTLLFWIAFAIRFCANGIAALFYKIRGAFTRKKHTKQPEDSKKKISVRYYRYAAVIGAVLLVAAVILLLPKLSIPATECKPQNASNVNTAASSEVNNKNASSQSTPSLPSELQLGISKPIRNLDGTYQFTVSMKADETGNSKLEPSGLKSAESPFYTLSGLKIGSNTVTVSGQDLNNLLPASNPKCVIVVDTTSYVMAPGDVYGIKAQLIGKSEETLTAHSSDEQIAELITCSSTYYQVVGHKEGTCEIVFEANGMRATTQITVQEGAEAHGDSGRVLAAAY